MNEVAGKESVSGYRLQGSYGTTCNLHPAPCNLHPAPCNLHPATGAKKYKCKIDRYVVLS
jgi:hypothetical protein